MNTIHKCIDNKRKLSVECSFSGNILFINYKTSNFTFKINIKSKLNVFFFICKIYDKNCLFKDTKFCLILLHYNMNLRLRIVNSRIQDCHRLTPDDTSWSFIGSFCSCSSLITWSWTLTLATPEHQNIIALASYH